MHLEVLVLNRERKLLTFECLRGFLDGHCFCDETRIVVVDSCSMSRVKNPSFELAFSTMGASFEIKNSALGTQLFGHKMSLTKCGVLRSHLHLNHQPSSTLIEIFFKWCFKFVTDAEKRLLKNAFELLFKVFRTFSTRGVVSKSQCGVYQKIKSPKFHACNLCNFGASREAQFFCNSWGVNQGAKKGGVGQGGECEGDQRFVRHQLRC